MIENYIKYVENFLINYYKILLGNQYDRKLVKPFIDRYIDVRYYNNSIYERKYSFVEKLNKELKNVAEEMVKQDKSIEESVKKIFILFGYILYIDDCSDYENLDMLLLTILEDSDLDSSLQHNFKNLVDTFVRTKKDFLNVFDDKNFQMVEKRIAKKLYRVSLIQKCKISPIYSEWAIDKAYNSGVVLENRQYLLYMILSGRILFNNIKLCFEDNYVVEFPVSLFNKEKKINKYLKIIDNKIIKPRVHLSFSYKAYLENREVINKLINNGFNVAIILDDSYDNDLIVLDLFSYVFVYEKYEYYDILIENKDNFKSKIVSL